MIAGLRLVLLDRGGVLPGAMRACSQLAAARLPIAVVTNQSAVGLGLIDEPALRTIHGRLVADLAADGGSRAVHPVLPAPAG